MTTVSIPVRDGTLLPSYVARPTNPSPTGVIVAHELFGVTPGIQSVADDLARAGHLAIAPEFYHRAAPPGRWLPSDDAGRAEGFGYLNRLHRRHAIDDTAAGIAWLRSQPGIERIGMVGFSAGGHLAFLAACSLEIDRTAVLYGGWLPVTDIPLSQPTPTLDLTPGISGRLLYLVGEDDFLITAEQRGQIAAALRAVGPEHELVSYPETGHAFWWPGTPMFSPKARDDAWSRILALLASLQGGDVVAVMPSGLSRCGTGSPDPARRKPLRRAHPTATAACSVSIAMTGPARDAWHPGHGRHGDSVPSRDQSG
jgi:carboxymethylenebutenolidase